MEKYFNCINCGGKNFVRNLCLRKKFDFTNSKMKNDSFSYKEPDSCNNIYIIPSRSLKNNSFVLHSRGHLFYFRWEDNFSFRCNICGYIYTDKLNNIINNSNKDISILYDLYKNKKGF
jgi:hypothetical protein